MTTTLSLDDVASGVVVSVVPPATAGLVARKPPRVRLEAVGDRPVDDFDGFMKGSMAEWALT